jgi:DNA (cytosine-5)-methyltransferase 1
MKNKYTVGSLYAGVGGICLGFEKAGFDLKWANEFDKKACVTYRNNFKHNLIEGDVMDLDVTTLDKVDVLTGGFPCQPFRLPATEKVLTTEGEIIFLRFWISSMKSDPKWFFLKMSKI